MSKKYLSLEEAAERLGLTEDQLMRIREQGDIRGFADRGSWKFREEDVEEFLRGQQADSSPDFPIITDPSGSVLDDDDESDELTGSDSDVRLSFDESLFTEDDDAEILKETGSDVRLTGDSGPKLETDDDNELDLSDWGSDVKKSDSDSDVKLVGAGTDADIELDSDNSSDKLSDSDSDVRLMESGASAADKEDDISAGLFDDVMFDETASDESTDDEVAVSAGAKLSDSDSDVRLSEEADDAEEDDSGISFFDDIDSDSDVKLAAGSDELGDDDSDSDVKLSSGLERTDSDIRLMESPSAGEDEADDEVSIFADDSDLKLIDSGSQVADPDSGITLPAGSSPALSADESGLSLELDSGISLDADDSGISLESFDSSPALSEDSGISLEAADSGIALSFDDDSGISLDLDDDGDDMSRTMPMKAVSGAEELLSNTGARTTEFDVSGGMDDSEFELAGLDEDDEAGTSTSVLKFDEGDAAGNQGRTAAVGAVTGEETEDEVYADEEYADEEYEDEFEDEEFADDFEDEEGAGSAGFAAPAGGRVYRAEADWGTGTKVMIGMGTLLSLLSAVIGVELVRTMWLWTQPGAPKSGILEMIGGLFG